MKTWGSLICIWRWEKSTPLCSLLPTCRSALFYQHTHSYPRTFAAWRRVRCGPSTSLKQFGSIMSRVGLICVTPALPRLLRFIKEGESVHRSALGQVIFLTFVHVYLDFVSSGHSDVGTFVEGRGGCLYRVQAVSISQSPQFSWWGLVLAETRPVQWVTLHNI